MPTLETLALDVGPPVTLLALIGAACTSAPEPTETSGDTGTTATTGDTATTATTEPDTTETTEAGAPRILRNSSMPPTTEPTSLDPAQSSRPRASSTPDVRDA